MTERRFEVRRADWARDEEALRLVRYTVFVVEQKVPESLEWDGIDAGCEHAIAWSAEGHPVGCGRLLPDGHVGRMAVLREWRGRGVGGAILQRLTALAAERGHAKAMLNAQSHAIPFYERHGYRVVGDPFDEAGIPHVAMERALRG